MRYQEVRTRRRSDREIQIQKGKADASVHVMADSRNLWASLLSCTSHSAHYLLYSAHILYYPSHISLNLLDMPKAKSSASSGTRKKHARKAAGPAQAPDAVVTKEKKPKGKEKGKNKEPRQKAYIPPFKPAPIQPDPLDTMGLAHQLPPELLVILRRFGKKDAVTKRRALEEFQSGWVDEAKKEGDDSSVAATLVIMVPVWVSYCYFYPRSMFH